jgi:hypothetical protein
MIFSRASRAIGISTFVVLFCSLGATEGLCARLCIYREMGARLHPIQTLRVPPPIPKHIPKLEEMTEKERIEFPLHEAAKVRDLKRLYAATTILNIHNSMHRKVIQSLPDGTYIFLGDSKGNVAFLNQVMDPGVEAMKSPSTATFIGAHDGIYQVLEDFARQQAKHTGKPFRAPEIVMAGGFVNRDHRLARFDNGAGSRWSDQQHLDYSRQAWDYFGLPFDSRTEVINYAVAKSNSESGRRLSRHEFVRLQVIDELEYAHDPHLRKVQERVREIMRYLDRELPDEKAALDAISAGLRIPSLTPDERQSVFTVNPFFGQWRTYTEGEASRIKKNFFTGGGEEKFMNALESYKSFVEKLKANSTIK